MGIGAIGVCAVVIGGHAVVETVGVVGVIGVIGVIGVAGRAFTRFAAVGQLQMQARPAR